MVVFAVERFETLAAENLVELRQCTRTVWAFVESVRWTHELVDEATEDRGRMVRAVVGFSQHLLQYVSNPTVASRAIVLVLGVQLLEELRDVHAGAIREVPGFVLVCGVVAAHVAYDEFAKGFEIATTELHRIIVAGSADTNGSVASSSERTAFDHSVAPRSKLGTRRLAGGAPPLPQPVTASPS